MPPATIRNPAPHPTAPTTIWPRLGVTLDTDGVLLSEVGVLGPPLDGRLSFADVHEPSALLDYYFGYGERRLMLRIDDDTVEGRLATCYDGGQRSWWLDLDE
jgi:hypothetical protein